jgi:Flp pilus assembly protein TadD
VAAAAALALLTGCVSLVPRSRTPGPDAFVVPGVPLAVFDQDRCGPFSLWLVLGAHGVRVAPAELAATLPEIPGRGVLSVDLLIAARAHGMDAALLTGSPARLEQQLQARRPAILMLDLFDAPGSRHDVYHYVVADGLDPERHLLRLQYGDGKARWVKPEAIERGWRAAGHALLVMRPRADTDLALGRALALEGERRLDEAAAVYQDVLELRPEALRAWVNLGNVDSDRGRREDAEVAYRRALAIDPDDRDALNNLAWLLLEERSHLAEAEELAARAASRPGAGRERAEDTLGRVQLVRGRCPEAVRTFEKALASGTLAPDSRALLEEGLEQARACPLP